MDFKLVARKVLDMERIQRASCTPSPTGVIVTCRGEEYFGHIQVPLPDYSKEIVLLSKTSRPTNPVLIGAIRDLDPDRLELKADDNLDLEGRQNLVRRLGERLTVVTPEQAQYVRESDITVCEINFS